MQGPGQVLCRVQSVSLNDSVGLELIRLLVRRRCMCGNSDGTVDLQPLFDV
jgi:hypothetical protein